MCNLVLDSLSERVAVFVDELSLNFGRDQVAFESVR